MTLRRTLPPTNVAGGVSVSDEIVAPQLAVAGYLSFFLSFFSKKAVLEKEGRRPGSRLPPVTTSPFSEEAGVEWPVASPWPVSLRFFISFFFF